MASVGCAVMQCSNTEVGAGTMNPLTYLRVLGLEPWNVAYVEPSIRPDDSRYGENPNRLQRHTQFQVLMLVHTTYDLWKTTGRVCMHDFYMLSRTSAWCMGFGLGSLDGWDGDHTQFTYFQQAGSLQLLPISVEITYGYPHVASGS